jgi:hypothetical protein
MKFLSYKLLLTKKLTSLILLGSLSVLLYASDRVGFDLYFRSSDAHVIRYYYHQGNPNLKPAGIRERAFECSVLVQQNPALRRVLKTHNVWIELREEGVHVLYLDGEETKTFSASEKLEDIFQDLLAMVLHENKKLKTSDKLWLRTGGPLLLSEGAIPSDQNKITALSLSSGKGKPVNLAFFLTSNK